MNEPPGVSALICVRDGQVHLSQALASVLAQTAPPAEVLVVDDGSRDGSVEVARSYAPPVRVIQQPRLGLGAARNTAVSASSAELVAFLDCDDLWEPRKLELQLEAFAGHPGLDFCFTQAVEFAEEGATPRPGPLPGAFSSSLCARREAIERAAGFDVDVRVGELLSWLLRARELGMRELTLPEVLVRRRVHANNITRPKHNLGDYARLLKASLDRRRQSA